MKKPVVLIFLMLFILCQSLSAQNRYALIIGNVDYPRIEDRLPNAVNDTADIGKALLDLGFTVELKHNLRHFDMITEIDNFLAKLKADRNSEGFFWYAGHAIEINGEQRLLPLDVNLSSESLIRASSYSVTDLVRELDSVRNKLNVVVLDACRVPPAIGGGARSLGDTTRVIRTVPPIPPDLLIFYSTASGTTASDGAPGKRNSPFAEAFLNHINSTEPLAIMVNHISRETMQLTNQRQRPFTSGSILSEPYYSLNPASIQSAHTVADPVTVQPQTIQPPQDSSAVQPLAIQSRAAQTPDNLLASMPLPFSTIVTGSVTTAKPLGVYAIVLPQPGRVSLNLASDGATSALPDLGADVHWLNAAGGRIGGSNNGFSFPYTESMDLNAGTWYIEIIGRAGIGNTGAYKISVDYFTDEAEPNNTRAVSQLLAQGLTITGRLVPQDIDIYMYELTQPGRIQLNITRNSTDGLNGAYIRWLDIDGVQLKRESVSLRNPYNGFIDLEVGIYFAELTADGNNTGAYNLRGDFIAAGNNETEPNNTRQTAQPLLPGQRIKGLLSSQDKNDTYRTELPRSGRLTVNVTRSAAGGLTDAYIRWFDSNGTQIKYDYSYLNPYNASMDLAAGVYYIEITPYGNFTGTYTITITQ